MKKCSNMFGALVCFMILLFWGQAYIERQDIERQDERVLEQRGFKMITEYDKRKKRCEELGGKYNVVETNAYRNEWCSDYLFERTY